MSIVISLCNYRSYELQFLMHRQMLFTVHACDRYDNGPPSISTYTSAGQHKMDTTISMRSTGRNIPVTTGQRETSMCALTCDLLSYPLATSTPSTTTGTKKGRYTYPVNYRTWVSECGKPILQLSQFLFSYCMWDSQDIRQLPGRYEGVGERIVAYPLIDTRVEQTFLFHRQPPNLGCIVGQDRILVLTGKVILEADQPRITQHGPSRVPAPDQVGFKYR